jgi:hypothetical protein
MLAAIFKLARGAEMHRHVIFMAALGLSPMAAPFAAPAREATTTAAQIRSAYAGKTRMTYSSQHGTQVEYVAPDGRNFLWYPGNRTVLPGRWKVDVDPDDPDETSLCQLYPSSSYNPVTQTFGGSWECEDARHALSRTRETLSGDPFGLARRRAPPFVLAHEQTSFAELLRRVAGN